MLSSSAPLVTAALIDASEVLKVASECGGGGGVMMGTQLLRGSPVDAESTSWLARFAGSEPEERGRMVDALPFRQLRRVGGWMDVVKAVEVASYLNMPELSERLNRKLAAVILEEGTVESVREFFGVASEAEWSTGQRSEESAQAADDECWTAACYIVATSQGPAKWWHVRQVLRDAVPEHMCRVLPMLRERPDLLESLREAAMDTELSSEDDVRVVLNRCGIPQPDYLKDHAASRTLSAVAHKHLMRVALAYDTWRRALVDCLGEGPARGAMALVHPVEPGSGGPGRLHVLDPGRPPEDQELELQSERDVQDSSDYPAWGRLYDYTGRSTLRPWVIHRRPPGWTMRDPEAAGAASLVPYVMWNASITQQKLFSL